MKFRYNFFLLDLKKGIFVSVFIFCIAGVFSGIEAYFESEHSVGPAEFLRNVSFVQASMNEEISQKGELKILMEIADCNCPVSRELKLPEEYYDSLSSNYTKERIAEKYFKEIDKGFLKFIQFRYFEYRVWGPVQEAPPTMPR